PPTGAGVLPGWTGPRGAQPRGQRLRGGQVLDPEPLEQRPGPLPAGRALPRLPMPAQDLQGQGLLVPHAEPLGGGPGGPPVPPGPRRPPARPGAPAAGGPGDAPPGLPRPRHGPASPSPLARLSSHRARATSAVMAYRSNQ